MESSDFAQHGSGFARAVVRDNLLQQGLIKLLAGELLLRVVVVLGGVIAALLLVS